MARFAPTPAEKTVGLFTLAYVLGFTVWFLSIGNYEFVVYIVTMAILIGLVAFSLRAAEYPPAMLWALSLWGLAHMAGGGVPVDGSVLYNLRLLPLIESGEVFILKYDQVVHAWGFGVTAWVLHHLLTRHFPETRGTWTAATYPAFAAMGLGALNEIIEFTAVLAVPDTNVGGYYNTALDLCFNAGGAVIAMVLVSVFGRRVSPRP
ncbi:DUF2238 domain-containing protein [Silicimonas algicola]|uniref:Putative membrane protein DUF2238 n=1 Tax=Silicimonas algicola TaxID=1826607 RepID=A0A316GCG3_9RHOB|nr:DUF2238 domain-containing protein [Silicimonas algicola]AZQ66341.1 DUF2238 domain-containing protein [Silicimonas algicola]PWK58669.1 putative membrane protein DUF2238 [Silicimonas algicola]